MVYFSAAGNFGSKSYQNVFTPAQNPASYGIPGDLHDFGGGDIFQSITLAEGTYVVVLQWEEVSPAQNDLDIYLSNDDGSMLFGFNRNNIGGDPIEVLPFIVEGGDATTNIVIARAYGSDDVNFKYIVFRGDLEFNEYITGTSTIVGQANSAGAIAVGAVKYDNTPVYGVDPPTIASFSSTGGTPVNGEIREKPEITAPNGVNVTVQLSPYDLDGDGNYDFFGTSAAAPHAAGVAALIMNAKNKFDNQILSPADIE